jgi:beta-glucosidase
MIENRLETVNADATHFLWRRDPRMKTSLNRIGATCVLLLMTASSGAQNEAVSPCPPATCLYLNPSLPAETRAADLVHRMTLEEKVQQTLEVAPAIPRLGVASYDWWNEALHGVARNGYATVFPQAIGLGATWDEPLIGRMAAVISTEARAKYNEAQKTNNHGRFAGLTFWSPNINIFRDPRWGRGQETYGEDPFLTGTLGTAFVKGLQGNDPRYLELVATPKHFAVHSGPEPLRHRFNVDVSPHDLEDTYLPAFRRAIVEGKADSIMCAYNAIDGLPACDSPLLLQQHLRAAWGFQGYVVSDCDAVGDIVSGHKTAPDPAHGSADAVLAGTDLDCGKTYAALGDSVRKQLLPEAGLDKAVTRLFTARIRLGLFDPPAMVPFSKLSITDVDTPANRGLALDVARESIVLLKNDGTLPLKGGGKRILVVGPSAETIETLEGNYMGTPSNPVRPLQGIRDRFGSKDTVVYAPGATFTTQITEPIPSAYLRAGASGDEPGLRGEYFDNADMQGEPRLTRVDPSINFHWGQGAPAGTSLTASKFSVRWTGRLLVPGPGDYRIRVSGTRKTTERQFKLVLDGKVILDGQAEGNETTVSFKDTGAHDLVLEYIRASENINLEWLPPAAPLLADAVKAAQAADVVVAFVGLSPLLEGEEMTVNAEGFLGGDRTRIELPESQEKLLEEVGKTAKPVIVVLMTGSAITSPWAMAHAAGILCTWYPGEAGGEAIAEVLDGTYNPAGRLPVTFYRSTADLPDFEDYSMKDRTYRYHAGPVLFPFGFGLSYSQFTYSKPVVGPGTVQAGSTVKVRAKVTNSGKLGGDEVAELYLFPPQTDGAPLLTLQGFRRVHLEPGETQEVVFDLDPRQISLVNGKGERAVTPGEYRVGIGGSIDDARAHQSAMRIVGAFALPE